MLSTVDQNKELVNFSYHFIDKILFTNDYCQIRFIDKHLNDYLIQHSQTRVITKEMITKSIPTLFKVLIRERIISAIKEFIFINMHTTIDAVWDQLPFQRQFGTVINRDCVYSLLKIVTKDRCSTRVTDINNFDINLMINAFSDCFLEGLTTENSSEYVMDAWKDNGIEKNYRFFLLRTYRELMSELTLSLKEEKHPDFTNFLLYYILAEMALATNDGENGLFSDMYEIDVFCFSGSVVNSLKENTLTMKEIVFGNKYTFTEEENKDEIEDSLAVFKSELIGTIIDVLRMNDKYLANIRNNKVNSDKKNLYKDKVISISKVKEINIDVVVAAEVIERLLIDSAVVGVWREQNTR